MIIIFNINLGLSTMVKITINLNNFKIIKRQLTPDILSFIRIFSSLVRFFCKINNLIINKKRIIITYVYLD